MKLVLTFAAVCCLSLLASCTSSESSASQPAISPGAVTECTADCKSKCGDSDASMGAVGGDACPSSCTSSDASLGAVGSPSCEGADKPAVCPVSGQGADAGASLGAVSEAPGCHPSTKPSGCSKSTDG